MKMVKRPMPAGATNYDSRGGCTFENECTRSSIGGEDQTDMRDVSR